jgi:hypothetical protein
LQHSDCYSTYIYIRTSSLLSAVSAIIIRERFTRPLFVFQQQTFSQTNQQQFLAKK